MWSHVSDYEVGCMSQKQSMDILPTTDMYYTHVRAFYVCFTSICLTQMHVEYCYYNCMSNCKVKLNKLMLL